MKKFQPNALDRRDKMVQVKKPSFFKRLLSGIVSVITYPFRMVWRGVVATAKALYKSPVTTYKGIVRFRDSFISKVQYLEAESAKWKTAFKIVKMPYSLLISLGLSPQLALTLIIGGSTVGGGVIVNETLLAEKSFARGDAGVYSAPSDVPTEYSDDNNTLRLDLGTTPVGEIVIENITVGTAYTNSTLPSGETNVIIVGGLPTATDFTATWLEVGHLIIDRWRCTKLTLDTIEVHTLNVTYNASDGQSIAPVAGVPRNRGIGGGNRADDMRTSGGYYDQIKITAPTSAVNGKVDVLRLSNLFSKGGPCVLQRIKAGTIDITMNEVGNGDGLAAKDFTIATSVIYKTFNNIDNVEELISPP